TEILPFLGKDEAKELQELGAYPETTAGGRMTTEFVRLSEDMTTDQAIAHVRAVASEKETIYYGYVLGPDGTLKGVVSLASLVMAKKPDVKISTLMSDKVVEVYVDTDQEEVARIL